MTAAAPVHDGVELAWLLAGLVSAPRVAVRDLRLDSREVGPGDAFVALAGRSTHGLDHVGEAVARGAIAVIWDPADGRQRRGVKAIIGLLIQPAFCHKCCAPGQRRAFER